MAGDSTAALSHIYLKSVNTRSMSAIDEIIQPHIQIGALLLQLSNRSVIDLQKTGAIDHMFPLSLLGSMQTQPFTPHTMHHCSYLTEHSRSAAPPHIAWQHMPPVPQHRGGRCEE